MQTQTMIPMHILSDIDNCKDPMNVTKERLERAATENQFMNGKIHAISVSASDFPVEEEGIPLIWNFCRRTGTCLTRRWCRVTRNSRSISQILSRQALHRQKRRRMCLPGRMAERSRMGHTARRTLRRCPVLSYVGGPGKTSLRETVPCLAAMATARGDGRPLSSPLYRSHRWSVVGRVICQRERWARQGAVEHIANDPEDVVVRARGSPQSMLPLRRIG